MDKTQIQVRFTIPASETRGEFSDALYFDQAAYETLTKEDLEAAKQKRYEDWATHIDAQNAINRDPAVMAQQVQQDVVGRVSAAAAALAKDDGPTTRIYEAAIEAVKNGNTTPAQLRAAILEALGKLV